MRTSMPPARETSITGSPRCTLKTASAAGVTATAEAAATVGKRRPTATAWAARTGT